MSVLFKILKESFLSALKELWNNRLRTFLTLLGISIGIFCVISIFSAVDSLENNMRTSIDKLGSNVIYVSKWPWDFSKNYAWWKYWNRPHVTYNELKMIEERVPGASAAAIALYINGKVIKYKDRSVENANIAGVSLHYDELQNLEFQQGRYFSALESNSGAAVTILGAKVRDKLFPEQIDPVGKKIELMGSQLTVTGVFAKEGESVLNNSTDNLVMLPYHFLATKVDMKQFNVEPTILVKAGTNVSNEELKDEIRGVLRNMRHQRPREEDNFALNQISVITHQIGSIFGVVNIVGLIIGGFAILVGGFGIANIMFVSVKERTHIIGIKKALGAKSYFILLEFLIESVVLSIIGGLLGLLLVYTILLWANNNIPFRFEMSAGNIVLGVAISAGIGIASGFIPALSASRLDPVEAIRSK